MHKRHPQQDHADIQCMATFDPKIPKNKINEMAHHSIGVVQPALTQQLILLLTRSVCDWCQSLDMAGLDLCLLMYNSLQSMAHCTLRLDAEEVVPPQTPSHMTGHQSLASWSMVTQRSQ